MDQPEKRLRAEWGDTLYDWVTMPPNDEEQKRFAALADQVEQYTRAADADRQELRNATTELRSMTSRLDALVNHLMSQG